MYLYLILSGRWTNYLCGLTMFILSKPGCQMDIIKQLLPTLSWTRASQCTNSLMACPGFSMNSPGISNVYSAAFNSLSSHSYSPWFIIYLLPYFLAPGLSTPLSYGTCFYNTWQKISLPQLPSLFHIPLVNRAGTVPWKPPFWYMPLSCGECCILNLLVGFYH